MNKGKKDASENVLPFFLAIVINVFLAKHLDLPHWFLLNLMTLSLVTNMIYTLKMIEAAQG